MVEEGKKVPSFALENDAGETVKPGDFKGRGLVIYFYPKDDTSGCTKEAIEFTALADQYAKIDTTVLGISPDSVAKHQKFKAKHDLDVTLLADEDKAVAEKFGVWVEKKMYGKTYMGVERSTFLIDEAGKVRRVWRKVKVPGHALEVLEAAKEMRGTAGG